MVFATSILVWLLIPPMVYSTADIVTLLDEATTQDEHQLGDNMASIDVGSNLVSDRRSDNGIPVDMAPGPMEASPGRGGGDVEGGVNASINCLQVKIMPI